ncbi:MAG TPA: hypothetical protein VFM65_06490 [Flavobacteriaceae bacterium]|nr:hypothetical protein [Flavobacteriaceae bacterium]
MKKLFLISSLLIFFLVPTSSFAQDLIQKNTDEEIAARADEMTKELTYSLGLTAKQALLVEDKLTEFLIYRKEINNSKLSPDEKIERLKTLDNSKFSEMREILTQRQYEMYVKIK